MDRRMNARLHPTRELIRLSKHHRCIGALRRDEISFGSAFGCGAHQTAHCRHGAETQHLGQAVPRPTAPSRATGIRRAVERFRSRMLADPKISAAGSCSFREPQPIHDPIQRVWVRSAPHPQISDCLPSRMAREARGAGLREVAAMVVAEVSKNLLTGLLRPF